jgi:glycosyltransferase involved in cell wall biosynthesis
MSTAGAPFVSVVIPVRDDADGVQLCVAALADQTYPAERYEIVLVDDGSADPLRQSEVPAAAARVVHQARSGSYAARNAGIDQAAGEIIAFTDSDCVPKPDWLERACLAFTQNPDWQAIAGRVTILDRGVGATASERFERRYAFPQASYVEADHFGVTANLIVRRCALDRAGRFDGRLQSGGDWEWGQRARAAGVHMVYVDDVVVQHPARRTLGALLRKQRRVTQGLATLARMRLVPTARIAELWRGSVVPPVLETFRILRDPRAGRPHQRAAVAGIRILLWCHRLYLLTAFRLWPRSIGRARDAR